MLFGVKFASAVCLDGGSNARKESLKRCSESSMVNCDFARGGGGWVQERFSDTSGFRGISYMQRGTNSQGLKAFMMWCLLSRVKVVHIGARTQGQKDGDYVLLQKAYNDHTINVYLRAKVICGTDEYERNKEMRY